MGTSRQRFEQAVNLAGVNGRSDLEFRFWLNVGDSHERNIAAELTALKDRRRFQPTIRDAVRLLLDLMAGRTVVLQELFPWALNQPVIVAAQPRAHPPRTSAPEQEITITAAAPDPNAGKRATENFIRSMLALQGKDFDPRILETKTGNAKAMDVPQFAAPSADDFDFEL